MTIREKYISAEEFWEIAHLPENANKHMELIDGIVYETPLFGFEHGVIAANCTGFIGIHVRANDLGRVTMAGTGYIIHSDDAGKDTILAPDVGFIAKARASTVPSRKFAPLAPDLAVEVVSPNDAASEIHAKVNKYLQYGTRAVWVAYPETHTVVVHTPDGAKTLGENEILDGGDILPGFTLPVRDIFLY
jgi:Uma2 family endonuclease